MENRSFTLIKVYIRWTQSEVKCISKVSSPYTRRPHPRELGTPAGAKAADWALLLCTRPYPGWVTDPITWREGRHFGRKERAGHEQPLRARHTREGQRGRMAEQGWRHARCRKAGEEMEGILPWARTARCSCIPWPVWLRRTAPPCRPRTWPRAGSPPSLLPLPGHPPIMCFASATLRRRKCISRTKHFSEMCVCVS